MIAVMLEVRWLSIRTHLDYSTYIQTDRQTDRHVSNVYVYVYIYIYLQKSVYTYIYHIYICAQKLVRHGMC